MFNIVPVRLGANVQNQDVHALCGQDQHLRYFAVPSSADAERGLVSADLGGGVIKQRIARPRQGKSGGFRTLIVFRAGMRAIFVHGFAKNEKDNIEKDELVALKKLAAELLAYDDRTLARVVASGVLVEVNCNEKTVP
ncbi:MAG: type II toxin-antitoxin system RelE/ParE family toxin [Bryobacteraceae bacterium]